MRTPWFTQSIHTAIDAHRTIRRRRAMHAQLVAIYGPTKHYGPPEPGTRAVGPPEAVSPAVVRELRKAENSRQEAAQRARREREARIAFRLVRLLKAQNNCCYICAEPFYDENPPTKDHVWPRARGGKNSRNILWACLPCNNEKADSAPTEAMMVRLREINLILDEEPLKSRTPRTFVGRAFRVV